MSRQAKFRSETGREACLLSQNNAPQSTYCSNRLKLQMFIWNIRRPFTFKGCNAPGPGLGETSLARRPRLAVRVIFNSSVARVSFAAAAPFFEGLELDFVWKGTESIWDRLSPWAIDKNSRFPFRGSLGALTKRWTAIWLTRRHTISQS